MGLDSRYVLAPSLQEFFIDKDSGLPLSGGLVYFYQDNARNIPKDVFEISGSPPNYSYTVLPNPVILSAVGTFEDGSGNDILPYYFPLDAQGNVQLYYIEVYNSGGVLQFTREGWPNFTSSSVSVSQDITNFVPNGQFLLHNNIPASSANNNVPGEISQAITTIAQGGWTFERSNASTATDIVTFPRYGSAIELPTGNPKYAVQIVTTVAGTDTRKDLCLTFRNVNTFASATQDYNFYFEAESITGSDINNVEIIVRKFFGTGGTPTATSEVVVTAITLKSLTVQSFNTSILFGVNTADTIGTNNDDYVQLVIRLPVTGVQSALFTDFALTLEATTLTAFPTQTEAQQLDASTAGWLPVPDPNGFDLYLPSILTPSGMTFDHSQVGTIVGKVTTAAVNNELLCDGSTYLTSGYSALGIPYQRLFNVLFSGTTNGPLFGSGVNYVNTYQSTGLTNQLVIATNKGTAAQTVPADGGVATGFTFGVSSNVSPVGSISYRAFSNSIGFITAISLYTNASAAAATAGNSGMSVVNYNYYAGTGTYKYVQVQALTAAALAAGAATPGLYFTFSSAGTNYYMWFKVTSETDPAPGGIGIQCNLTATMSAEDVGEVIAAVWSSEQTDAITVTGVPPAGSYFTFHANSVTYSPWYQVAGLPASAPAITNPIQVTLTGAETSAQVAGKTQAAINSQYFAVPDLRGMFLRGNETAGTVDIDVGNRWSYYGETAGSSIGTFQASQLISHLHNIVGQTVNFKTDVTAVNELGGTGYNQNTALTGGTENRPINMTVNWYIKY